jgi:hypothetical protein
LVIGWRCITPGRPEIDRREVLAGQESKMAAELICGPPAKVCFRDEIAVALGKELLALRSKAASNASSAACGRSNSTSTRCTPPKRCGSRGYMASGRRSMQAELGGIVRARVSGFARHARQAFERRIVAGEDVKAKVIARARGGLPTGRPRRRSSQPAQRIAA